MKTEQLIVKYLYNNKKVTLQDIGVFTIVSEINIPEDSDKDIVLPADAIQFAYDPKAPVDDGLVAFIMESTRKIKPLAYSDLESFIILNKQFLNIGKPLVFEGLGTLIKTQGGQYAFSQAATSHVINEEAPKLITEKLKEKVSFATPQKEKNSGTNKTAVAVIAAILLLSVAIAAIYFITKNKKDTVPQLAETSAVDSDTLNTQKPDTATQTSVTVTAPKSLIADSNSYYVVIKEFTDVAKATKSYNKLLSYGNKVVLTTKDSITYKLRMPFKTSLVDTLRTKDSLAKFFQAKTYVELP